MRRGRLAVAVLLAFPATGLAQVPGADGALPSESRGVLLVAVDKSTGEPVKGAQVKAIEGSWGGATGEDGRLWLGGIPAGRHAVTVERLGYAAIEAALEVPAEGWRAFRIDLTPAAVPAEPVTAAMRAFDRALGHAEYRLVAAEIPDHTPVSVPELIAYRIQGIHKPRNIDPTGCPIFMTRNGFVQLFIVDGIRYRDACVLEHLHPTEIAEIGVVISLAGQAEFGKPAGGVVLVRTKVGNEE